MLTLRRVTLNMRYCSPYCFFHWFFGLLQQWATMASRVDDIWTKRRVKRVVCYNDSYGCRHYHTSVVLRVKSVLLATGHGRCYYRTRREKDQRFLYMKNLFDLLVELNSGTYKLSTYNCPQGIDSHWTSYYRFSSSSASFSMYLSVHVS